MSKDIDILVLGVTGFTGRRIARYLSEHPQRATFKLALGARSLSKLYALAENLKISRGDAKRIVVDVTNKESVQQAVARTKVIINAVGPYFRWGTLVLSECAKTGTHYVDLSAEPRWVWQMILYGNDFLATQTGAIIVPSCGFDSIPSDISAYLSVKALKAKLGPETHMKESMTFFSGSGAASGGTYSTLVTTIEEQDTDLMERGHEAYALSPVKGSKVPFFQFSYYSELLKSCGCFYFMSPANRLVVRRTWGLKELESPADAYGREFTYDEAFKLPNSLTTLVASAALVAAYLLLSFSPTRWLLKWVIPAPGQGPSEEVMAKSFYKIDNVTTSATTPPVHAKSHQEGHGDPGYVLTSIMISECALLLLKPSELTPAAKKGGMLTPMTAFGDKLIESLEKTGKFTFSAEILPADEDRKTK